MFDDPVSGYHEMVQIETGNRILILTLSSGENEFDNCCRSIRSQENVDVDHRVFEHLPNTEAHARLYETVMAERDRYGLFFKLDADMVLADEMVLADLVRVFDTRPRLDHLVVAVSDWMTRRPMIGAHIFSSRVSWQRHEERLYVDPDPQYPGEKIVVEKPPRDLIFHCFDPSPWQAFHFGAHRALQASQSGRSIGQLRAHNARLQWEVLDSVWRHWEDSPDRRLGLAVLAADMVFSHELPPTANEYSDTALREAFSLVESLGENDIRGRLEGRWADPAERERQWRHSLGPMRSALVRLRAVRDRAVEAIKRRWPNSQTVEIGGRS